MVNWVKATYWDDQVDNTNIITTLECDAVVGRYNIFSCDNGDKVVIFLDQVDLLEFVSENIGSVFLIRKLLPDNNKYQYSVEINGETDTVYTLARASVLLYGTLEDPRTITHRHSDGLLIVE